MLRMLEHRQGGNNFTVSSTTSTSVILASSYGSAKQIYISKPIIMG